MFFKNISDLSSKSYTNKIIFIFTILVLFNLVIFGLTLKTGYDFIAIHQFEENEATNLPNDLIKKLGFISILSVSSLLIVFFFVYKIMKNINNQLIELTIATEKMTSGDLTSRVKFTTVDNEIGKLGTSINQLVDYWINYNQRLKLIVREKTKELQDSNFDLNNKKEELAELEERINKIQQIMINLEKSASLAFLTAGVEHEIKNALNFINNFSILSLEELEPLGKIIAKYQSAFEENDNQSIQNSFKELADFLSIVIQQGKRSEKMLRRMLDYHHQGEGDQLVPTNIHALLQEYIDLAYHSMRVENVNFNAKIETNFDPKIDKVKIIPGDMSRAFLNLINNAFYSVNKKKSILGSSYDPIVSISTHALKGEIEICIRDNGLGISEDIQAKIFSPFFTTKPTGLGTGLGLSITHDIIVKEHKGKLRFKSKEGEFAEFIITLLWP